MGWWSNVKETYQYQKAVKEHQKYCKAQQEELAQFVKKNSSNPLEADLARNMYLQEQATTFRPTPTPPTKSSWLGRLFGGRTRLSKAEEDNYEATKKAFSNTDVAQEQRSREHAHIAQQLVAAQASGKVYAATVTENAEIVPGVAQQMRDNPTATNPGMASKHHTLPYQWKTK